MPLVSGCITLQLELPPSSKINHSSSGQVSSQHKQTSLQYSMGNYDDSQKGRALTVRHQEQCSVSDAAFFAFFIPDGLRFDLLPKQQTMDESVHIF